MSLLEEKLALTRRRAEAASRHAQELRLRFEALTTELEDVAVAVALEPAKLAAEELYEQLSALRKKSQISPK